MSRVSAPAGGRDGRAARHVSRGCCCTTRACAASAPRSARKTSASGRPGPGRRLPTRCARSPAASPRRVSSAAISLAHRRRQPPAPLLRRCAAAQCLGGIPVPLYHDAAAQEMVFVLPERRDRVRDRRGPGAGRQAARDPAAVPEARAHLLRRCARACGTTAQPELASYESLQASGPRVRCTRPRILPRRGRQGPAVGHRRRCSSPRAPPASRRAWFSPTTNAHHRRPHGRGDGRAHARRGGARVHAARVDRAEHLLLRAALRRRLLHLLPRVGRDGDGRHARDRADATTSRRRACSRRCSRR